MRKLIKTYNLEWDEEDILKRILKVEKLPDYIIIETFEENGII